VPPRSRPNELIDSALGGVLFIDEAYGLVNEGDGQGDRFGNEAVQALLTRAEDDRDDLIIILAGYERQMEGFLASNPGLTSRFAGAGQVPRLHAGRAAVPWPTWPSSAGASCLIPTPGPVLWRMFEDVGRRKLADELGKRAFSSAACWKRPARTGTSG